MSTARRTKDEAVTPRMEATPPSSGTGRRFVTFRIWSVLVLLLTLAMHVFGLTELVFAWLPASTVAGVIDDPALTAGSFELHRSHWMAIGIASLALVATTAVQLRGPRRRVGSMQLVLAVVLTATVVFGLDGTLGEWLFEEVLLLLAPILVLAWLHPRRGDLVRRPQFDRPMGGLALVAVVPWGVYAVVNGYRQLALPDTNPHVELEHYAIAAILAVVVAVGAAVGAAEVEGRRLPAWLAVVGSLLYGLHSLAFPATEGALPGVFAIGAVGWAIAFGAADVSRSRRLVDVAARETTTVGAA